MHLEDSTDQQPTKQEMEKPNEDGSERDLRETRLARPEVGVHFHPGGFHFRQALAEFAGRVLRTQAEEEPREALRPDQEQAD